MKVWSFGHGMRSQCPFFFSLTHPLDGNLWLQLGLLDCVRLTSVSIHTNVGYGPLGHVAAEQRFVMAIVHQLPPAVRDLTLRFDLMSAHTANFSCLYSRATWDAIADRVRLLPLLQRVQLQLKVPSFIVLPTQAQKATLLRKVQTLFSTSGACIYTFGSMVTNS